MFVTSPETDKLDAALAKAQGQIEPATKTKTNSAFGKPAPYADIHDIWEACRKALSTHGLSVSQWPVHTTDNRLHLLTRIALSGQWMHCTMSVPVKQNDVQGYGAAITYLKRFTLAAALGIVAAEENDDDGNTASGRADLYGYPSKTAPVQKTSPKSLPKLQSDSKPVPTPKVNPPSKSAIAPEPSIPELNATIGGLLSPPVLMAGIKERTQIIGVAQANGWTPQQVCDQISKQFGPDLSKVEQLTQEQVTWLALSISKGTPL